VLPLIYLLKSEPVPTGPLGEKVVPYACAERVRRVDGKLRAENIQVPIVEWEGQKRRVRGRFLPERSFSGLAYRLPSPEWFAFDGGAGARREEQTNPADIERRLQLTPLGRLCRKSEVIRALAQDRLAATLAPFLAVPDLLENEDRLLEKWEIDRPEAFVEARASIGAEFDGVPASEARAFRKRVRLAALRRIDATAVGREVFLPCPSFFGEPYLDFELGDGFTLKAGAVRMAHVWPKPDTEALSRGWRGREELVRSVESRLCPLLPPTGSSDDRTWGETVNSWLAVAPLRDFEARSLLPLFPCETIYPEGYLPPGYRVRIHPETARSLGGSYLTLAAARLSPYIAEPFHALCEARRDLLDAWSEDPMTLAKIKWG
jgi:hypothetical protein